MAIIYGESVRQEAGRTLPLHEIIESNAARTPEKIAIYYPGQRLSYGELEKRASCLAGVLREHGISPNETVGIFLERGPGLVVAQLGILKAGGAFAAFDPAYPRVALFRFLQTVPSSLVITDNKFESHFPNQNVRVLDLSEVLASSEHTGVLPQHSVSPNDAAVILFTSGSTGLPKAVLHTHRNLVARFQNTASISDFDSSSVFAQISPLSSIDSIDEVFVPLCMGGCSLILPYDVVVNTGELIRNLKEERATHLMLVPSLLRVLLSSNDFGGLDALKTCLVGGEALAISLANQFHLQFPSARLINYYGLTEGDVSYHEVNKYRKYSTSIPVGRAIQNTVVCLLNEDRMAVPIGEVGEICVAGEGMFREYLGRDDLNSERWIPNPISEESTPLYPQLFMTGDLGRLRDDGEIEYVGRKDRMVKIRGFRVELGEVEAALLRHEDVVECAVVAVSDDSYPAEPKNTRLIAYVVPVRDRAIPLSKLFTFAAKELPDFAVPADIVLLHEMPLSPNGKVDVRSLPKPGSSSMPARDQDMASPRNLAELELASIWERLLHRAPIGIHDNYFEIGGDSLAAIEIMLDIEKKFKRSLAISVLMQAPTIATLAELLGTQNNKTWSSLVPIRTGGNSPPLFCVHADGSVFFYHKFGQIMDREIPIYGLQARGLLRKDDRPLTRIEEMAACYIEEIRAVQPHGPYHLCGYSSGGFIIFEMARQLHEMGEQVALVGMLDAYGPNYPQIRHDRNIAAYKLSVHLNTLRVYDPLEQLKYLWKRTWKRTLYTSSAAVERALHFFRLALPYPIRYNQVARLVSRAEEVYEPKSYQGDIVLFRASIQPENIVPDEYLGWRPYVAGNIKIHDIPGTHNSIMQQPRQMVLELQTYLI